MKATTVELRKWSAGDWAELLLNGEVFHDGHDVPDHIWLELLVELGVAGVSESEVASEDD